MSIILSTSSEKHDFPADLLDVVFPFRLVFNKAQTERQIKGAARAQRVADATFELRLTDVLKTRQAKGKDESKSRECTSVIESVLHGVPLIWQSRRVPSVLYSL